MHDVVAYSIQEVLENEITFNTGNELTVHIYSLLNVARKYDCVI
jgi:hypothetical protein